MLRGKWSWCICVGHSLGGARASPVSAGSGRFSDDFVGQGITYMYIYNVCVYTYLYVYVYVSVCIYVCVYLFTDTYMYIYICI